MSSLSTVPGLPGELETGYRAALLPRLPRGSTLNDGVSIPTVSPSRTRFTREISREISRLLRTPDMPVGTVFYPDWYEMAGHAAPLTVGTNQRFTVTGVRDVLWRNARCTTALRATFENLSTAYESADAHPVLTELIGVQEEQVHHACDKYLRRYEIPPPVAVFPGPAYALFAADTLIRYLDAEILAVGTRNDPPTLPATQYPVEKLTGLEQIWPGKSRRSRRTL